MGERARQLLLDLDELRAVDVVLPVEDTGPLRLSVVARPNKPLAELLAHLGLELPRLSKTVENVVPKSDLRKSREPGIQYSQSPA
jgi:hypothetical protein